MMSKSSINRSDQNEVVTTVLAIPEKCDQIKDAIRDYLIAHGHAKEIDVFPPRNIEGVMHRYIDGSRFDCARGRCTLMHGQAELVALCREERAIPDEKPHHLQDVKIVLVAAVNLSDPDAIDILVGAVTTPG